MSTYPPSSSRDPFPQEEYELTPAGDLHQPAPAPGAAGSAAAAAGPVAAAGRRTSTTGPRPRKLTLHPNASTGILFAAPGARRLPPRLRRRASSNVSRGGADPSLSPTLSLGRHNTRDGHAHGDETAAFLQEDDDAEEVHVPDIGHMLGLDEGDDHFAIAASMRSSWKRRIYLLMEEPSSSREAFHVHILVTGLILFSAMLTVLSTLPSFHTDPGSIRALFGLDTAIVVLFTIEYLARSLAHSDSWTMYRTWATSFFAILDLLSIAPYYIEVAREQDTSIMFRFSILRTFRLLRVFRAFAYHSPMLLTIEVMYVAVRRSKEALVAISYFILLVLVLFATLIYFAERGTWDPAASAFVDPDGEPSLFDSIPQTAWYALVTMSTAGYGDVVPKTALGKILSVPLLLFGLLLIALPSFVLGRNFAIVYDAMISAARPPPSPVDKDGSLSPVDEDERPLLPTHVAGSSLGTSAPPSRMHSRTHSRTASPHPNPLAALADGNPLGNPLVGGGGVRMWDAAAQGLPPSIAERAGLALPKGKEPAARGLSTTKLAKNQAVLLDRIEGLRRVVEAQQDAMRTQAEMLERLLALRIDAAGDIGGAGTFGASAGLGGATGAGIGLGLGATPRAQHLHLSPKRDKGKRREGSFALGDSDDGP